MIAFFGAVAFGALMFLSYAVLLGCIVLAAMWIDDLRRRLFTWWPYGTKRIGMRLTPVLPPSMRRHS